MSIAEVLAQFEQPIEGIAAALCGLSRDVPEKVEDVASAIESVQETLDDVRDVIAASLLRDPEAEERYYAIKKRRARALRTHDAYGGNTEACRALLYITKRLETTPLRPERMIVTMLGSAPPVVDFDVPVAERRRPSFNLTEYMAILGLYSGESLLVGVERPTQVQLEAEARRIEALMVPRLHETGKRTKGTAE